MSQLLNWVKKDFFKFHKSQMDCRTLLLQSSQWQLGFYLVIGEEQREPITP